MSEDIRWSTPPYDGHAVNRRFHTYGGDTVLRSPKDDQDDRAMIGRVQRAVAGIYFAGDANEGEDRNKYIRRGIGTKFQS